MPSRRLTFPGRPQALGRFLHDEAAGGAVLLLGAVIALVWANSPWAASYTELWSTELRIGYGGWQIEESLQHWVNDALMTLFFFVVGLEVKRELVVGELRTARAAALPVIAAIGGVVVPAAIYLAIVPGGDESRGWGVPMATDIAFAVGVLALLGRRASTGAKLFLLSIAIVDDIIAIVVIALFYSDDITPRWMLLSIAGIVTMLAMRRLVLSPWLYVAPGFFVWLGFLQSGVHATLAGVVVGLITPAVPVRGRPVIEILERRLHPWSAFVAVPVFAVANAGVDLGTESLAAAVESPVTWGVGVGLVVGKLVGISGATFLALRLGLGVLPRGMARREVWPVAALAGIGFTVSIFIAQLAFGPSPFAEAAKIGIFGATIVAVALGAVLLRFAARAERV